MRQVAYPAALGSCAFGAAAAFPLHAAEWTITPVYSAQGDFDSNRSLLHEGTGSTAYSVSTDVKLQRAVEDLSITFEPHYTLRRLHGPGYGNGDDRSAFASVNWNGERTALNLSASY